MYINKNHPRADSLKIREKLVKGLKQGLVSKAGLIAHGRGEAFDYLLDEKTHPFARKAIEAAAACLLLTEHPILSINGNAAALSAKDFVKLAKILDCKIEVNLFHFSKKRAILIEKYLKKIDKSVVLEKSKSEVLDLPDIASPRKTVIRDGIAASDVVFVPLEDGDRCQALIKLGKKVITIDLNPLSRTAQNATVTIVDNLTRALPLLIEKTKELKNKDDNRLLKIIKDFNNKIELTNALTEINRNLIAKKIL